MYQREATAYDTRYVKRHTEDLNTTLVFVRSLHSFNVSHLTCSQGGLFAAVSSAFIVDINSEFEPDSNGNAVDPSGNTIAAAMLLYASLMSSLLAAFAAILVKQWLSWYLKNASGSMADRCGDRQRRCDGFDFWEFRMIIEALPVLLHASTLLFTLGISFRRGGIGPYVRTLAYIFSTPAALLYGWATGLGLVWEMSSYRTPTSIALRGLWNTRHKISVVAHSKQVLSRTYQMLSRRTQRDPHRQPPSTSSVIVLVQRPEQWLKPEEISIIQRTNVKDVRCASWVLWKIVNPEALDIAIRFAGAIRWFEDGPDVEPPYDLIISTLEACFNPAGKLYPALRDKAYYSARALLWIHVRAMCVSEELVLRFPLPNIPHDATSHDEDFKDLFKIYSGLDAPGALAWVHTASPQVTPAHQQWTWDVLLHMSWAKRSALGTFDLIARRHVVGDWSTVPLDAVLNRLLTWCIFLGWPVDEVALMVQNTPYAIYLLSLSSCYSFMVFPAITRNRSYLNYPKRSFRPSRPPTLDAISFHTCCLTWPSGNGVPAV